MNKKSVQLIRQIADDKLAALLAANGDTFSESRAKALLFATNALDQPTLNDFYRLIQNHKVMRVAVGDLLSSAETPELLTAVQQNIFRLSSDVQPQWLAAAMATFAAKHQYDVGDLDPAYPPSQHSPAGQIVHHTAAWVRRQVSRSVLDRERLARQLAFEGERGKGKGERKEGSREPLPAVRPPVPVRHFEFNEQVTITPNDPVNIPTPIVRNAPISISAEDLREPEDEIRILGESRRVPRPQGVPVPPNARRSQPSRASQAARNAGNYVRENVTRENVQAATQRIVQGTESVFNSIRESIGNDSQGGQIGRTRLRITVMDYPNGHGLPGTQITVRYTGSRKEVAGATANDGEFIVSLPAKRGGGITYEVTVFWPHEFGNKREKKRITVHPDRPEFSLAFYSRLVP